MMQSGKKPQTNIFTHTIFRFSSTSYKLPHLQALKQTFLTCSSPLWNRGKTMVNISVWRITMQRKLQLPQWGRVSGESLETVPCAALPWFDLWYLSNHSLFHPLSDLSIADWQSLEAEPALFLHICVVPDTEDSKAAFGTVQTQQEAELLPLGSRNCKQEATKRQKAQLKAELQVVCPNSRSWFALEDYGSYLILKAPVKSP